MGPTSVPPPPPPPPKGRREGVGRAQKPGFFFAPPRAGDPPTARCLIFVSDFVQLNMNTFLGAWQFLPPAALDEAAIADARKSDERLREAIDILPQGVVFLDPERRLRRVRQHLRQHHLALPQSDARVTRADEDGVLLTDEDGVLVAESGSAVMALDVAALDADPELATGGEPHAPDAQILS